MRLVDSNIIIYATAPENEWLRTWLEVEPFAVSQISQIEVLGYHQITPEEITDLEEFLYSSNIVPGWSLPSIRRLASTENFRPVRCIKRAVREREPMAEINARAIVGVRNSR